jgi:hypothetical protein
MVEVLWGLFLPKWVFVKDFSSLRGQSASLGSLGG